MREEVTQYHRHATIVQRFDACQAFIHRINAGPEPVISRLWPKFNLDRDCENSWFHLESTLILPCSERKNRWRKSKR
jgi:hypothetical protein